MCSASVESGIKISLAYLTNCQWQLSALAMNTLPELRWTFCWWSGPFFQFPSEWLAAFATAPSEDSSHALWIHCSLGRISRPPVDRWPGFEQVCSCSLCARSPWSRCRSAPLLGPCRGLKWTGIVRLWYIGLPRQTHCLKRVAAELIGKTPACRTDGESEKACSSFLLDRQWTN